MRWDATREGGTQSCCALTCKGLAWDIVCLYLGQESGLSLSHRYNLFHYWQRNCPEQKALMSVSLATKHWQGGGGSQSRRQMTTQAETLGFPSLALLFWTPALGWGYSKGTGALQEVVQGAQPYILEWSALVWLWGCRSCSISPRCPSQSHRFSLETPEKDSKKQRLQI